jgi:hypothetical protein
MWKLLGKSLDITHVTSKFKTKVEVSLKYEITKIGSQTDEKKKGKWV